MLSYSSPNLWNYGSYLNLDSIIRAVAGGGGGGGSDPLILSPKFSTAADVLAWWQSNPTGVARYSSVNAGVIQLPIKSDGTVLRLENQGSGTLDIQYNGSSVLQISQEFVSLVYSGGGVEWSHAR
jgi:hypothetical protein